MRNNTLKTQNIKMFKKYHTEYVSYFNWIIAHVCYN